MRDEPGSPVLGLLAAPGVPPGVLAFLVRLQRWATVRAVGTDASDVPSAWFATAPTVHGLDPDGPIAGRPVAVWVDRADQVESAEAVGGSVTVFVTPVAALADRLGPSRTIVAGGDGAVPERRARSPFLRSRWRRRLGYPETMVVTVGRSADLESGDELVPTALAIASAAVVTDPGALLTALALGCPTVTGPASAEAVGAVDGAEVLVVESADEAVSTADELAADPHRAAALGAAGVRLVQARHDPAVAAREVAGRLGLRGDDPGRPLDRVLDRLDELGTPLGSRARRRAADALTNPNVRR